MDTSGFFDYEGHAAAPSAPDELVLLPRATEADWDVLLRYCDTLRFRPGERVLPDGEADRALYVLADGRLDRAAAPAVIGEAEFFSGLPRRRGYVAETDGELLRLSFEAFEAMAAREPRLAREVLLDLGRLLAVRVQGDGAS